MKRNRMLRIFTQLTGVVLLFGLATAPKLKAEFECNQELFAGTWVHHAELSILEREGTDIFPPPGPFSEVGIFAWDEQGKGIVSRQTNSTSTGIGRANFINLFDIQNTINPDCTGRSLWTFRDDVRTDHPLVVVFGLQGGQTVFDFDLVCANGQRECWMTFTEPPAILIGIVKMKRVDPFDQQLAAELAATKLLVRRVAAVLGVLRRGE